LEFFERNDSSLTTRHLQPLVQEALLDTPAVLINGPRHCGKATLARQCGPKTPYVSLDDASQLAVAQSDPVGFVRRIDCAAMTRFSKLWACRYHSALNRCKQ